MKLTPEMHKLVKEIDDLTEEASYASSVGVRDIVAKVIYRKEAELGFLVHKATKDNLHA